VKPPYLDDGDVRLYQGDVLDVLREMDEGSVQTCVTSPPYWGLRDYGTASWEGGSDVCDHVVRSAPTEPSDPGIRASTLGGGKRTTTAQSGARNAYRETCGKCGARRVDAQIGLEPTPGEYVARMVEVFREVRRVLRDDGTLWLNLGDSYAANGGAHGGRDDNQHGVGARRAHESGAADKHARVAPAGLKHKDLVGIPWRVAFALQADGWWLRSDIIWAKPNPMPESITDRPTRSHEYLFLLTKSARYFYDYKAVQEPLSSTPEQYLRAGKSVRDNHVFGEVAGRPLGPSSFATVPDGRNARSVWTITTKPYAGAHFATFPPELPSRCIKAGSATGDIVLDPFSGAATTALVARGLGRRAVGIELNPEYLAISADRLSQLSLFNERLT
jgi:DNA modification methylase